MHTTNSPDSILRDVATRNAISAMLTACEQDCRSDSASLERIIQATQNTFRLLCNLNLAHPTVSRGCAIGRFDMSGVVCISGAKRFTIAVNASESFCKSAYTAMTAEENATTADLHDTLGELANQLVGSAKDTLQLGGLELGLPTMVWGVGHHVAFTKDMQQHVISFSGVDGLRIEVGIAP